MKRNEIKVYLKKEIYDNITCLADLMEMPSSKLLRLMIEEETFQATIKNSIALVKAQKKAFKDKESQLSIYDIK